jgi:hypothetical protein
MSGPSQDWILIAVFFGAFLLVTIGEIYWLAQRLAVPIKKALTTVFLSNFVTITLGFFVTLLLFGILLAITADDANVATNGLGRAAAFVAANSFPVVLMAATRRLLISGLRIEQIGRPLTYAIVSTVVFFAAVVIFPLLLLTAIR